MLLIGSAPEHWIAALHDALPGATVTAKPDPELAALEPGTFDLCFSIGTLETADDLASTAFTLRHLLAPGGMLLGAVVGGNSLPRLREAMLAADRSSGTATPRTHPAIDGPSLCALFASVGLVDAVVDVDRVDVRYPSLDRLVADLRAMGCTNILAERSRRPLTRAQAVIARKSFMGGQDMAVERFELLQFAASAPLG